MRPTGTLTTQRIIGAAFSLLGLYTLIFQDLWTGLVWMLLGNCLLLFTPSVDRAGRRYIEWDFQNLVAAGALIGALVVTAGLFIIGLTG